MILILLDVLIQTWLRYLWRWRPLTIAIIAYDIPDTDDYFSTFLLIVCGPNLMFIFMSSPFLKLAFFTTRKVEAFEELTWVSWFLYKYFEGVPMAFLDYVLSGSVSMHIVSAAIMHIFFVHVQRETLLMSRNDGRYFLL